MHDYLVTVGKIVNTHGINGELKVVANWEDPKRFTSFREVFITDEAFIESQGSLSELNEERLLGQTEFVDFSMIRKVEILSARAHKGTILVSLKGVDDIDSAKLLIGKVLAVKKDDLPKLKEGLYYIFELVGLICESTEGKRLGVVKDLIELPASDALVILEDGLDKKEFMVPMVKAIVKQIDLEGRRVIIEDLKGLR